MPNERLIPHETTTGAVTTVLKVDGNEVDRTIEVLGITIEREINRIPYAKLIVKDGDASQEDFPNSNMEIFAPGKLVEVLVGYDATEEVLFTGIIVKHGISIKGSSSILKLDCRDVLFKSTLTARNNFFFEATDSSAFDDILSSYELDFDITDTEVTHPELVQYEATDWAFITQRAKANGLFCFPQKDKLYITPPALDGESVLTLTFGATILAFDAEIDARHQFVNTLAQSWDYSNQELLEVEAEEPTIPGGGNLTASELADVGGADLTLRHSGQVVQEELQDWANARLLEMRLQKLRGRVQMEGFPQLKLGDWITLQGVGERFNGLVYISGIRHEVHAGKWNTHIQFGLPKSQSFHSKPAPEKAASGLVSAIPGIQIGVVTQIQDDPASEGRIQIKIPVIDTSAEGIWARVGKMFAGESYGACFLPDIDDEVIVGFVNGDPRDPIILGALHSSAKTNPIEVTDDNYEKGIITPEELKILFDDEKKVLKLETPAGKQIHLDEDQGVLQFVDENSNKIVMDSSGITLESGSDLVLKATGNLTIEGGSNVEAKAGASFKAEGSAGAEVSTSAVAVLKGSLVQIN